MSEIINNRSIEVLVNKDRLNLLRELFADLHAGQNIEEVKTRFKNEIGKVTIEEVAALQHGDIDETLFTTAELQSLYRAHADIFDGAIEDVYLPIKVEDEPGHPIHTFKLENRAIEQLVNDRFSINLQNFAEDAKESNRLALIEDLNLLFDIDKHYNRKEHLIFPYLERYGIPGPTTHMWKLDDFNRDAIREMKQLLIENSDNIEEIIELGEFICREVILMIQREENILFPMALKNFTEDEWIKIANESDEIGYCLIDSVVKWRPDRKEINEEQLTDGYIKMETGLLSVKQLELLLNHLPVDITFIDHEDVVRYFSHGKERIFARTKAVIGRTVQNCHPPKSMHIVEEILNAFKSGEKDTEDFWIKFRDKYVYIRYFAVRDDAGKYMGTIEFSQNIDPIQAITGEKRIMS